MGARCGTLASAAAVPRRENPKARASRWGPVGMRIRRVWATLEASEARMNRAMAGWARGIGLIMLTMLAAAEPAPGQGLDETPADALASLNRIRTAAGLIPFVHQPLLDRAALNHARYLSAHRTKGHGEMPGRAGFTGAGLVERARAVGYGSGQLGENVATGSADTRESLERLMSAIYHRIGFLSFDLDEAGAGSSPHAEGDRSYVYAMGGSGAAVAEFCRRPDPAALLDGPGRYYEVCPGRLKVKAEAFEALQAAGARRNPRVIVWPPRDGQDVPVTFSGERPNPLPGRAMSGYPLSVHFNAAHVRQVRLLDFRLFERRSALGGGRPDPGTLVEVKPARVLKADSDPNRVLGPLDFALFPLGRLEWDRAYFGRGRFVADGKEEEVAWTFRTRALGVPLYDVRGRGEELALQADVEYAVRVAPTRAQPILGPVEYAMPQGVDVKGRREDENTLRLRVSGPLCARVSVSAGAARFAVRLASSDTTAGPVPLAQLYGSCPEYSAHFKVRGSGELLRVRPGSTYRIYVLPSAGHPAIGTLSSTFARDVVPRLEFEDESTLRAAVRGPTGREVKVQFSGGRTLTLLLDKGAAEP